MNIVKRFLCAVLVTLALLMWVPVPLHTQSSSTWGTFIRSGAGAPSAGTCPITQLYIDTTNRNLYIGATTGTCTLVGGATVISGTANTVAKFTSSNTIGNGAIVDGATPGYITFTGVLQNSAVTAEIFNDGYYAGSGTFFGWTSIPSADAARDTCLYRVSPGVVGVNTSCAAGTAGSLSLTNLTMAGTVPTYNGIATAGNGVSSVQSAPTVVTIGSGTNISATSLCSTTQCPAGDYDIGVYVEVTTACTTTGGYIVWFGWTDDQGAKTGSSTTTYLSGGGLGVTPSTASAGASLALASTANFMTGHFYLHTTGVATGGLGSINYGTTATACGTGGPAVGGMYLTVTRVR